MVRFEIALLILLLPVCGLAQRPHGVPAGIVEEIECSKLPDSPGALLRLSAQDHANLSMQSKMAFLQGVRACNRVHRRQSHTRRSPITGRVYCCNPSRSTCYRMQLESSRRIKVIG